MPEKEKEITVGDIKKLIESVPESMSLKLFLEWIQNATKKVKDERETK